jgi:endoglucanase
MKLKKFIVLLVGMGVSYSGKTQLPTAMDIYNNMTIGWNIGNTMDAGGPGWCNPSVSETCWGNPLITQAQINAVKAAGFNSIRIPCQWDWQHVNQTTLQIDPAWMARVTQVVDYCMNQNMYVVLNIHWDGGWLENNINTASQTSVNTKQQSYWTQIANNFKNYDERLLFASANEPDADNAAETAVLLSYHQTFINAVRATGGNNSSRTLIVQAPRTNIDLAYNLMNPLNPTYWVEDVIADRLMLEVHWYDPYNFCLMNADEWWGNQAFYWGTGYHSATDPAYNVTWGEEAAIESTFNKMKTRFVDNCIPVIIGEFGAMRRTAGSPTGPTSAENRALHLASREYFYEFISDAARRYGMRLFIWDTGNTKNGGTEPANNSMTVINRNTGAVVDPNIMNALLTGFNKGTNTISGCPTITANPLKAAKSDRNFEVLPNPNAGVFTIAINGYQGEGDISLYDALGKLIYTFSVNFTTNNMIEEVNLPELKSGIYYLSIANSQGNISKKLVVE